MIGAIIGDLSASSYQYSIQAPEYDDIKIMPTGSYFTSASILTFAVAETLLQGLFGDPEDGIVMPEEDYRVCLFENYQVFVQEYPNTGYCPRFISWLRNNEEEPYNSSRIDAAIGISPIAWYFSNRKDVMRQAKITASVTHKQKSAINAAQAVACAIFLARNGESKQKIKEVLSTKFRYDLDSSIQDIKISSRYDDSCSYLIPVAIQAFLESDDFASAIRNAIWVGGDCCSQASIAGAIAEAFYGQIEPHLLERATCLMKRERDKREDGSLSDVDLYNQFYRWNDLIRVREYQKHVKNGLS